ncbi:MAG TPA: glycoside hydrolase family 2 TIM barrel-domain containing protein [Niabella sp.]|nr:glycoside hydrolase family 2 TIM barrel-domain containing protein [Niabella sp.]
MNLYKRIALAVIVSAAFGTVASAQSWKPVEGKIMSPWAEKINPEKPLPEYPRPQLKRSNWQNLNGLWQYAITAESQANIPASFAGQILVPYPVESALSGVGKQVGKDNALWYKREIEVPKLSKGNQLLLHFGAVDWRCDVYINGKKAGTHEGGFDPFSFNITPYLTKGKKQEIVVRVWDPTDEGPQPRGKQVNKPEGIWYTPVTGIWQTVWTEEVPAAYIASTKHTPDIDGGLIKVKADIEGVQAGDIVKFVAFDGAQQVGEVTLPSGVEGDIAITDPKLWSPSSAHLYRLKIYLSRNGKQIDYAESYFALRKTSLKKDANGINRLALNNNFLFQYGPLDQGWWPDGLYTAPTDEALLFDIVKTKEMGFNMIRKHIKLEPARWYYYCDSLGMMVWQDMPSGDLGGNRWDMRPGQISGFNHDKERSPESEGYFRKEWKAIMDAAHNFPSIVVWVPFNEAWGQFKTKEITEWTMKYDPSRLVNSASGGNFFNTGDILDIHHYPDPQMPDPAVFGNGPAALVLGEFGGLGLPVEGHTWQEKNNWGYQSFKNKEELMQRYTRLMKDLKQLIPLGLSAAVYTQTTDVEIETNGILTYDRKVMKMPESSLMKLHQELYDVPVK